MGEPLAKTIPGIADAACLDLVREYCRLATRPTLNDAESQRLDDLLSLAEQDGRLDFWLNEADHFIDHAIGLDSATQVYASANENLKARLREQLDLPPSDNTLDLLEDLKDSLTEATPGQHQLTQPGSVDGATQSKIP
ncbi:MAG TPA: hypothetical protein VLS96_18540 [Nodosilinea sp.]|nr:hypothetical protein [Nodosilinea sp.]